MTPGSGLAAFLLLTVSALPLSAEVRLLEFSALKGWESDNHEAALEVFRSTCEDMTFGDWPAVCALADRATDARTFFETVFRPLLITDGSPALFTGYYEPELVGSLKESKRFSVPLYRRPPEAPETGEWFSRKEIEDLSVLKGRGLEIAWVEDPVEKFFLQVQGSGRIRLEDGKSIRVGYGGKNGHPYRSIGEELVRRGVFEAHQVSAQVIRTWVRNHPEEGADLLNHNPSYVFFREVSQIPADMGPLGAMDRSITGGRTIAVDPEFVPLGAPVWIEKDGASPMRRLMVAQDTGSAIRGAQRGDIFFGTGAQAGRRAGRVRDGGRMIVLLPIEEALARIDGS